MADRRPSPRANGFSMVEMLVALVFTLILMAGMASVFKASLSTFYTSGEVASASRRSRMSIDLMGDDLNTACMYLGDPDYGPDFSSANPPFYILPNCSITGAPGTPGPNDPVVGDELYFFLDQPLPFQGKLPAVAPQQTNSELANSGSAVTVADQTYTIECLNSAYANMVTQGDSVLFMDNPQTFSIVAAPVVNGTQVTIITGGSADSGITGKGAVSQASNFKHSPGCGVQFFNPNQMVRYRLQYLQLDPTNANGTPCLVRDQGTYGTGGFAANQTQQVITENVQAFKVYLSVNSGQSWAGLGDAPASPAPAPGGGFSTGWDQGLRAELDTQLGTGVNSVPASGRPGYTSTRNNNNMGENWFRFIPTLVRVDVTTRSAAQRTEYATTAGTAAYKAVTQTLIFMPRHSGLPLGWN